MTDDEAAVINTEELACTCSASEAWERANYLTSIALEGDRIGLKLFAWHIDHAIRLSQRAG